MRILLISTLTGVLSGIWLYIATHPVSMTRLAVYGFLFIVTVLTGLRACDRIRHQQGMWGQQ